MTFPTLSDSNQVPSVINVKYPYGIDTIYMNRNVEGISYTLFSIYDTIPNPKLNYPIYRGHILPNISMDFTHSCIYFQLKSPVYIG